MITRSVQQIQRLCVFAAIVADGLADQARLDHSAKSARLATDALLIANAAHLLQKRHLRALGVASERDGAQ
jgi:hypothetical protein